MAEKDSTTKTPENSEWLADLMHRAFWPLDGFLKVFKEYEDYGEVSVALIALVDAVKQNLDVVDNILVQSFGSPIKIETSEHFDTFGLFQKDDFRGAFIAPAKETKQPQAAPEGGA